MPKRTLLTYHGETLSLTAWGRRKGIPQKTLWWRLVEKGWDVESALETPVQDHKVAPGILRWCPVHEVAWCREPVYEHESYWHPMRRGMIDLALRYAKAFGCEKQITVEQVACDQCRNT